MENKLTRNDIFKLVEPGSKAEEELLESVLENVNDNKPLSIFDEVNQMDEKNSSIVRKRLEERLREIVHLDRQVID
jgi:hypothetical protein